MRDGREQTQNSYAGQDLRDKTMNTMVNEYPDKRQSGYVRWRGQTRMKTGYDEGDGKVIKEDPLDYHEWSQSWPSRRGHSSLV